MFHIVLNWDEDVLLSILTFIFQPIEIPGPSVNQPADFEFGIGARHAARSKRRQAER